MKRNRKVKVHRTRIGGPIEDVHDAGEISKNGVCKRCLEFYSGYGKIEISVISQKFLPTINTRS